MPIPVVLGGGALAAKLGLGGAAAAKTAAGAATDHRSGI